MKQSQQRPLCVSIFKNGASTTTQKEFTKVWTDLINRIEKGRAVSSDGRQRKT